MWDFIHCFIFLNATGETHVHLYIIQYQFFVHGVGHDKIIDLCFSK